MSVAAQPLTPDDSALSPWWLRTMLLVMTLGFAGLLTITSLAYRNAPPIPAQVVDAQGAARSVATTSAMARPSSSNTD